MFVGGTTDNPNVVDKEAGMLSLEDNDEPRALKNLAQYVELAPPTEQPPMMRVAVQQLREQLANPQKP